MFVFFFFCICAFIRADILTTTPPASFGISSAFFNTVGKIFIYFNKSFYIDKNGGIAFFAFRLVFVLILTRLLSVFFEEYNPLFITCQRRRTHSAAAYFMRFY